MFNQDRAIRSFSRRIGKRLSKSQQELLEEELPGFLVNPEHPLQKVESYKKAALEIGIGMAEHFINQCVLNPDTFFIGSEPYLNGIANCLKLAKEYKIKNFSLWPDDADLIIKNIPPNSLNKVFILFPDPWPKTKQKKRRFAQSTRIRAIKHKLKDRSELIFASDIKDYVTEVLSIAISEGFSYSNKKGGPHQGYVQTKYHSKAISEGREAQFLILEKS